MSKRLAFLFAATMLASYAVAQNKPVTLPESGSGRGGAPMFSPGIMTPEGTLYISGQTGNDPKTRQIPSNFEDEVKNCLGNIGAILKAAGMDYSNVVSVQVFLTDMDLFSRMNSVYSTVFASPRPARTTLGVAKLASAQAHIEINAIAHK